jgi:2-dehydropantoate 2-reductase
VRFAVFGTGGVGGYLGGRLAQAGQTVAFLARGPHLAAIRRFGLAVESIKGDFAIRHAVATDDAVVVGPVDVVLLGVKAWQVKEAALALRPLLHAESCVVPLQNGVEAADELAAVIGEDRVLPGLCRIMSYVSEPGRIRHAGVDPQVCFGERDGRRSARVEALRAAFAGAAGLDVCVPDDIQAAIWEKFLFIAGRRAAPGAGDPRDARGRAGRGVRPCACPRGPPP